MERSADAALVGEQKPRRRPERNQAGRPDEPTQPAWLAAKPRRPPSDIPSDELQQRLRPGELSGPDPEAEEDNQPARAGHREQDDPDDDHDQPEKGNRAPPDLPAPWSGVKPRPNALDASTESRQEARGLMSLSRLRPNGFVAARLVGEHW